MFKKFKEFLVRTLFRDQDYVIGYDGDTGEEIRVKGSDFKESLKGAAGANAQIQFSANLENWHFPAMGNDIYVRFRVGTGEWSACRFVGRDGEDGIPGISAYYSADGENWHASHQEGDQYIQFQLADNTYTEPMKITGTDGTSPTIAIGTVTTGSQASVTNSGTEHAAVLDFVIPENGGGGETNGQDEYNGWSPVISVVTDGERCVLRLTDWTGGTGTKPSIPANNYITNTGLGTLANAIDIRGGVGEKGENGTNGKNIELQKSSTHVQWRLVGDLEWTNLILLSDLQDTNGSNGKSVELQVNSTHIQWRLVGDTSWINLISLDLLKGQNGVSPNITIGTVTTVAAGQQAAATITGTFPNLKLNLSIPRGADGSATEGGVTQQDIDNAIVLHNKDEDNHQDIRQSVANLVPAVVEGEEGDNEIILTPVPNTYYKFGQLNMLKLENIPTSMLPIVIWFSSADADTSLVFPESTKMLSGSAEIDANSVYELSIVNGIVAIAKIVISG